MGGLLSRCRRNRRQVAPSSVAGYEEDASKAEMESATNSQTGSSKDNIKSELMDKEPESKVMEICDSNQLTKTDANVQCHDNLSTCTKVSTESKKSTRQLRDCETTLHHSTCEHQVKGMSHKSESPSLDETQSTKGKPNEAEDKKVELTTIVNVEPILSHENGTADTTQHRISEHDTFEPTELQSKVSVSQTLVEPLENVEKNTTEGLNEASEKGSTQGRKSDLSESHPNSCKEELESDGESASHDASSHSLIPTDSMTLGARVISGPEDNCKAVFARIQPKSSEKVVRDKVANLLNSWYVCGKLVEIEKNVEGIPSISTTTVNNLALALKGSSAYDMDCTLNQIELAYKVYCWVTKNIQYSSSAKENTDPHQVLRMKQAVCHGYTTLYQAIAQEIGLKVNRVDGHARGLQDRKWTLDNCDRHTWNMVAIESTYFQVDCTHGSGYYSDGVFEPNFNRLYFFPAPERLILTHWVEDEQFQLLESPVSLNELQPICVLNQEMYSRGIMPETLSQFIDLPSTSPVAKFDLHVKSCDLTSNLSISASLKELHDNGENSTVSVVHNSGNSLTSVLWMERKATVYVAVPKKGRFSLDIYASEKNSNQHGKHCLSYALSTDSEVENPEYIGYPKVYEASAEKCDFSISNIGNSYEYACKISEKIELTLRASQSTKLKHYICQGKVSASHNISSELRCYTHLSTDEVNSSIHHITAVFPVPGWWTIFIINETNDIDYFLMQYQVYAMHACKNVVYPYTTKIGEELGIHPEGMLVHYSGNIASFDLTCTAESDLVISSTLKQLQPDSDIFSHTQRENDNPLTFVQQSGKKTTLHVALPIAGTFSLEAYAANLATDKVQKHCISYVLMTENELEEREFVGYPKVFETDALKCDFSVLYKESLITHICKVNERLEISLKAKQNARLDHYICKGKLTYSRDSMKWRSYTHLSIDERNYSGRFIRHLIVVFPSQGWWTIFIDDKDSYYSLMRYQVYATSECEDVVLYPYLTEEAERLGISLPQDKNASVHHDDASRPFAIKFTALRGLCYHAKLMQINENGNTLQCNEESGSLPCYTYVSEPQQGTCIGFVYTLVPPGMWDLNVYANEPQLDDLVLIISVKPLQGSDAMKNKVFPHVTSKFSCLYLSPPLDIEEWILPETVTDAEYPKNIKIPFVQKSTDVQLFCSVYHDNQELPFQNVAKLQQSQQHPQDNDFIHRILNINLSAKGEWTFKLKGRHLEEYNAISTLIEYTVRGL